MSNSKINLAERAVSLRKSMSWNQTELAEELGISRNYVSMLESGKEVDKHSSLYILFRIFEQQLLQEHEAMESPALTNLANEKKSDNRMAYHNATGEHVRMVPVIGMAHAGAVVDYDEIEKTSQRWVPTLCQDPIAFALDIQGDSMYPIISDHDCTVISPSNRAQNGSIVVARLKGEGVICRRIETIGGKIRLVPKNDRYEPSEHEDEDFDWIYPVFGSWTQLWRG